jgi:uncharacterized repeat protein (TIGR01451 family)
MDKKQIQISVALILALFIFGKEVWSAETPAGTTISNQASIGYSVGGVAQATINSAAVTFVVDRKVNLTVATSDTAAVVVAPGSIKYVLTFTVTNTGNGVQDVSLASTALAGGAAKWSGNDNVDASSAVSVYVESEATVGYQDGVDTATYIDELAPGAVKTVYIVGVFNGAYNSNDIASYHLLATAKAGGTGGSEGGALTETSGAETPSVVDTVFADGQGSDTTNDIARDAKHSSQSDFKVLSANLSLTKTSSVISDPTNNTNNPKAIPGAVVEYTITISNAAGSAAATDIAVTDSLNSAITAGSLAFNANTYGSGLGIQVTAPNINGGAAKNLTNVGSDDEGDFTTNVVTVSGINLNAGASAVIKFRVTVQ